MSDSDDDQTIIVDDYDEHQDTNASDNESVDHSLAHLGDVDNKKFKYGIVYLSYIPEGLNVRLLRSMMSQYGQIGRIYLEPENGDLKKHKYVEGWIEFKKKRIAKQVAATLNGSEISWGRKRCKLNGQVWSMKYLHKFKWANLIEQLNYDSKIKDQRRRLAMSQAKKVTNFYEKIYRKQK